MNAYKRRGVFVWPKRHKQRSQSSNRTVETDLDTFGTLKRQVKRIQIMTRMDNRANKSINTGEKGRPITSFNRQTIKPASTDMKRVQKQYFKEKSLMRTALQENKKKKEQQHGLLGEWRRYEQFSKQELIEKLISLEHLANTIYKKNKHLEEEVQKYKNNANKQ